jgi:hypothetical protein
MAIKIALPSNTSVSKDATAINGITSMQFGLGTAEDIDVTNFSSTTDFREYAQGLKDGDSVTLSGYADLADAGQLAVIADSATGATDTYTIPIAGTIEYSFTGYPRPPSFGKDLNGIMTVEFTFKVSGKPSLVDDATDLF